MDTWEPTLSTGPLLGIAVGDTFYVSPDPDRVHLFSTTTGQRLN